MKINLEDLKNAFGGTSLPNDSYVFAKFPKKDPYSDLPEIIEETFSDNKRIGRKKESYEF